MSSLIPAIIVTMAMVVFSGMAIYVGLKKNEADETVVNVMLVFAVISTLYFGWDFIKRTGLMRSFGGSGSRAGGSYN